MHTRILSIGVIFSEEDNSFLHLHTNTTSHAAQHFKSAQNSGPFHFFPRSYPIFIIQGNAHCIAHYDTRCNPRCNIRCHLLITRRHHNSCGPQPVREFGNASTNSPRDACWRQQLSPRGEGLTPASLECADVHAAGRMNITTFALER